MTTEPRSPSEAVAAADVEREQEALAEPQPEQVEEPEQVAEDEREQVEPLHVPEPVQEQVEPLGEAVEQPLRESTVPGSLHVPEPTAHRPTMDDLRRLLTDPEWCAAVTPPEAKYGPLVEHGDRVVPAVLLNLLRDGVIRGWS